MVAVAGALAFVVLAVLLVPWDPIPGGPLHPPAASVGVHRRSRSGAAEDFSALARIRSWSSLAVSLLAWPACSASPGSARRLVDRVRGPWWWRVVVAVAGPGLVGRLVTLPFAVLLRRRVLDYGLSHQAWTGVRRRPGQERVAVDVVATSIVARGAGRRGPALAARLAGGGRRAAGRAGDAGLLRLPAAGRAAVQLLRPAARRRAAHPDPRARRRGGRARRRRAGRRRVAAYDDAQRLRVRVRLVPPGGRLRQPARRRARAPRSCRWSPTSSATRATTTC